MSEVIIAIAELLEAEVKEVRSGILRLQFGMGVLFLAGVLVLAGASLMLWGAYVYLATRLGAPGGALVAGISAVLLGGCFVWVSRRIIR